MIIELAIAAAAITADPVGTPVAAPPTKKVKLVPAETEDGHIVFVVKKKGHVERAKEAVCHKMEHAYDATRHQMVKHPKVVRGAKWTAGGFLFVCNVLSAFRH